MLFEFEKGGSMRGGTRAGAGRRRIEIDLNEIEKLCAMGCSLEDISAWFRVSVRTIENRRKQPKFAEAMRRGQALNHISIRRHQRKLLESGNASMAIWLGKTELGQRDTLQIAGANGGPIEIESKPDFSRLSEDELRALRAALAKAIGKAVK
jgi:hypothetical protein